MPLGPGQDQLDCATSWRYLGLVAPTHPFVFRFKHLVNILPAVKNTMRLRLGEAFVLCCSTLGFGAATALQDSGALGKTVAAQVSRSATRRNLKVLPADILDDELAKQMARYNQYLGVPCGYCHVENPGTKQIDYVSDENPLKDTARVMIGMTRDINDKYLAQLGDRRYATPVTCANCHRGQPQPPDFDQQP